MRVSHFVVSIAMPLHQQCLKRKNKTKPSEEPADVSGTVAAAERRPGDREDGSNIHVLKLRQTRRRATVRESLEGDDE